MSDSESDSNLHTERYNDTERSSKVAYKSLKHDSPGFERKGNNSSPNHNHMKVKTNEQSEERNGSKKKRFINEFLNMTDSDNESDSEYEQNQKKLKAYKEKYRSKKGMVNDETSYMDSFNMKNNSTESKSSDKEQLHFLQKPHKKDYSKPLEQSKTELKESSKLGRCLNKTDAKDSRSLSPTSMKRKRSPVPQELRKVVTQILNENRNDSAIRKKPPCQYGQKCYRKNPTHFEEFSHPGGKLIFCLYYSYETSCLFYVENMCVDPITSEIVL